MFVYMWGKGKLHASMANFKLKLVNGVLVFDAVENHPLFNGFALSRSGPESKIFPIMPCAMSFPDYLDAHV